MKNLKKQIAAPLFGLVASLSFSLAPVFAHAGLAMEVDEAQVRMPIPGKAMTAAFMTIRNTTDSDDKLVSASARWADNIELHTHKHENGMMKMREVESISLPAHGTTVLQPGGLHLMIFGLANPLPATEGGQLPLELCFSKSGCHAYQATLINMLKHHGTAAAHAM